MTAEQSAALWDLRAAYQRAQVVAWSLIDQGDAPAALTNAALRRLMRLRAEHDALWANARRAS